MTTPHSFSSSSFSGADNDADQSAAKRVPAPLAHKPIRPLFASNAHPAAAVAPQTTAAADQARAGGRAGRRRRKTAKPITTSGISSAAATSAGLGNTTRKRKNCQLNTAVPKAQARIAVTRTRRMLSSELIRDVPLGRAEIIGPRRET